MKNQIKCPIAVIISMLFLLVGCKKEIMTYNASDYIAFTTDSTIYAFYEKVTTLRQDTIDIRLKLIGNVANEDREVLLVVDDSTTAISGKHFKLMSPVILGKDSNFVSAKVILYRTDDLKVDSKEIWFSLRDGKELLKATYAGNSLTTFKLRFSDKLEKPDWWDSYFYLYPWTEVRMQFYIDVMGSPDIPDSFAPNRNGLYYTVYKLKTALLEYNATHDTPLSDAYGKVSWEIDWINY